MNVYADESGACGFLFCVCLCLSRVSVCVCVSCVCWRARACLDYVTLICAQASAFKRRAGRVGAPDSVTSAVVHIPESSLVQYYRDAEAARNPLGPAVELDEMDGSRRSTSHVSCLPSSPLHWHARSVPHWERVCVCVCSVSPCVNPLGVRLNTVILCWCRSCVFLCDVHVVCI